MSEGNGTLKLAPYVECSGCRGQGFVKGPIDETTGKRIIKEHARCAGAGIMILRTPVRGTKLYYGAPKLS